MWKIHSCTQSKSRLHHPWHVLSPKLPPSSVLLGVLKLASTQGNASIAIRVLSLKPSAWLLMVLLRRCVANEWSRKRPRVPDWGAEAGGLSVQVAA